MKSDNSTLGFAYLRLSNDEAQAGESASITNQRSMIQAYCRQHSITLIGEFVDDGWSGGNFDRPAFQDMLRQLHQGAAAVVITKDLSRLGRDMREASYYAEQYFPEQGIRYIAIADGFDTNHENIMAPFHFAMNEVYLRDGSRKVKDVLRNKRENGLYCACPPYGYKKADRDKNTLVPDTMTAPIVQRIFQQAAKGDSSRKIALDLNGDGVIPPLKYRVMYRDTFSPAGAARASDLWNNTTVKRILKNQVYLGHTLLGRSRKVSVKSKKKIALPEEDWAITPNTHQPLVTAELFDRAQRNLGRGSRDYRACEHVRKSIFAGIAVCAKCGHALCSSGTVYKGEREKYWYLSCTHQRKDIANPCEGVRIRYADLAELVRQDLNTFLSLSASDKEQLVHEMIRRSSDVAAQNNRKLQREQAQTRLAVIDKMVAKLYTDNAEGNLDDARLRRMVAELEREAAGLETLVKELALPSRAEETAQRFEKFLALTDRLSSIETLERETLLTFVERIEIGPKELPEGAKKATHPKQQYRQSVKIFYKFIGDLHQAPLQEFPKASGNN